MARPIGKSSKVRQQILDAATRLFEQHGVAAVSMDDIVAEAGVVRATVYSHFGSKAALAAASARTYLAGLISALPQEAGPGQLHAALSRFAGQTQSWLKAHAAQAEIFFGHVQQAADFSGAPEDGPSLRRSLRSLFSLAREAGDLPAQTDTEFLADGYAYLWFMLCAQWLAQRDDAQLASRLAQLTVLYAPGPGARIGGAED
jgi:AcrR family transcriptional regulator